MFAYPGHAMLLINSDTVYIASTAREVFLPYLCRNGSGGTTMTQIALDMLTTGEGGQQRHFALLSKAYVTLPSLPRDQQVGMAGCSFLSQSPDKQVGPPKRSGAQIFSL